MTQNTGPTTKSEEKRDRLYNDYSGDSPPPYPAVDNLSLGLASLPTLSNISLPSPVGSTITSPDTTPGRTSHLSPPNEAPPSIFTPRHLTISSGSSGSFPPSDLGTPSSDVPREDSSPDSLIEGPAYSAKSDKEQTAARLVNNKKPAGAINLSRTLSDIEESPQTDSTSISGAPTSQQNLPSQPEEGSVVVGDDDDQHKQAFLFAGPPEVQTPGAGQRPPFSQDLTGSHIPSVALAHLRPPSPAEKRERKSPDTAISITQRSPVPEAVPFLAPSRRPSQQPAEDSKGGYASFSVATSPLSQQWENPFGHRAAPPFLEDNSPIDDVDGRPIWQGMSSSLSSQRTVAEAASQYSRPIQWTLNITHYLLLMSAYLATSRSFAGGAKMAKYLLGLASDPQHDDAARYGTLVAMALWGLAATVGPFNQTGGKLDNVVKRLKKEKDLPTALKSYLSYCVIVIPTTCAFVQMGNDALDEILHEDLGWDNGAEFLALALSIATFIGNLPLYLYETDNFDFGKIFDFADPNHSLGKIAGVMLLQLLNSIGAALAVKANQHFGTVFANVFLGSNNLLFNQLFGIAAAAPCALMNAAGMTKSVSNIIADYQAKPEDKKSSLSLTKWDWIKLGFWVLAAVSPTTYFSIESNLEGHDESEPYNQFLLVCFVFGVIYNAVTKAESTYAETIKKKQEAKPASVSFWQRCCRKQQREESQALLESETPSAPSYTLEIEPPSDPVPAEQKSRQGHGKWLCEGLSSLWSRMSNNSSSTDSASTRSQLTSPHSPESSSNFTPGN